MESMYGPFEMKFSMVVESTARVHNGGFCLRHIEPLLVEFSIFERCGHVSEQAEAAAVFLIYDNPYDSSIRNCSFVENRYNGSYTISVVFGQPLALPGSCFTGPREREVHNENNPPGGCTFGAAKCPYTIAWKPAPGYDPHVKRARIRRQKRQKRTIAPIPREWNRKLFAPAALASAVIAAVLTGFQTLMRRVLRDRVKVPRVLL
jgi:hypothetical protein